MGQKGQQRLIKLNGGMLEGVTDRTKIAGRHGQIAHPTFDQCSHVFQIGATQTGRMGNLPMVRPGQRTVLTQGIARATYGAQRILATERTQGFAQAANVDIDGPAVHIDVTAPDPVQ